MPVYLVRAQNGTTCTYSCSKNFQQCENLTNFEYHDVLSAVCYIECADCSCDNWLNLLRLIIGIKNFIFDFK